MWGIRYRNGLSGKAKGGTRGERKVERMQLVCLLMSKACRGADGSVPRRRGGMVEISSSAIDVEATSAENEGDLAASGGL